MLDLKRLQMFREVARLTSFTAAADLLHYSQSSISHHIARLEADVGAKLLERRPGGRVVLTVTGLSLYAHADRLLGEAAEVEAELADLVAGRSSRLRIGAFSMASATYLSSAIVDLRRTVPNAAVTAHEQPSVQLLEDLQARKLDVAIVFDDRQHPLPIPAGITYQYLLDETMLIGLPRGHWFAGQETIPLASLSEETWVGGADRTSTHNQILVTACRNSGFEPNIVANTNTFILSQHLISAGVGIGLVPPTPPQSLDPGIVLRPLDAAPTRRIGLISQTPLPGEPRLFREMADTLIQAYTRAFKAARGNGSVPSSR